MSTTRFASASIASPLLGLVLALGLAGCGGGVTSDGMGGPDDLEPTAFDGCLADGSGKFVETDYSAWGNEMECGNRSTEEPARLSLWARTPTTEDPATFTEYGVDISGLARGQVGSGFAATVSYLQANWDVASWEANACTVDVTDYTLVASGPESDEYKVVGTGSCQVPLAADGFYASGDREMGAFSFAVRATFGK